MMSQGNRTLKPTVGRREYYRRVLKFKEKIRNHKIAAFAVEKSSSIVTVDSRGSCHHEDNFNIQQNIHSDVPDMVFPVNFYNRVYDSVSGYATNHFEELSLNSTDNISFVGSSGDISLIKKLRYWATRSSVTQSSVTSLLHILSPYHPELPLDCRTLLQTPTSMISKQLITGKYCHFGISNALECFLSNNANFSDDVVEISFNVDGIPIFHSTNCQLWPILGLIKNVRSEPFAVGVFCGDSKPKPLGSFLEDFINELTILLNTGFEFKKKLYKVEIHSFVCDAPARAYLKCIKSHSGYSSCEKCNEVGEYIDGRIIFTTVSSPKRTDESFSLQIDDDHHLGVSPLTKLPIGLVTKFPIDYMHNVCLGVVRKILNSWLNGPLEVRLKSQSVRLLSDRLESLKKYIPVEFNRKPRPLTELARWKATELRTFLLYLGPAVLKNVVNIGIYEHFLLLHFAITILASDVHIKNHGSSFAGEILNTFVKHSKQIYGTSFLIYNVHILCHLADDVKQYGALDSFAAFPFENYLGQLKHLVKSTVNPLKEIHNRLKELNYLTFSENLQLTNVETKMEHNDGPLIHVNSNCKQFKKLRIKLITFSITSYCNADCYCLINGWMIVQINNIVLSNGNIYIIGKKFCKNESLYTYPFNSVGLDIYVVSQLSDEFDIWGLNDITAKCIVTPYVIDKNKYVAMPLIHSI